MSNATRFPIQRVRDETSGTANVIGEGLRRCQAGSFITIAVPERTR